MQWKESFKTLQLTTNEIKYMVTELSKLILLRGESIQDYNLELWIERLQTDGYSYKQIMEIIHYAGDLKKYGTQLLAYGDIIDNYKKIKDEVKKIDWIEFFRILEIYEKKALNDINSLAGTHISKEDYFKHKEYLENQFQKLYGKAV